ncbi:branched-chain amino acid aminotransferase [candidate division KD3-62 bacterium DG_56]|uniref:Branched-chain-amino-acid aminotransferase n=1 Tax=candidate division KD3-62 bacterium DG_56 TaxID=1704032 RepID=A0A0S7XPF9_9BACT|nr:MAG: branched-chain amino acid aminotransferase [candidate division KD3-62 bacterium DG_56]
MSLLVYMDGEYVPQEDAKISVYDHGFLYGDGVFEGIRAYHGRVFKLDEHLDRLYRSAKAIMLEIPLSRKAVRSAVVDVLKRNGLSDGYVRLIVTRGRGDLGLDPRKCTAGPSVVIIADKIALYPKEMYEKGLEVMTVVTRRNLPEAINPAIKSLNYLNNIVAKLEVTRAHLLEGVMLNHQGFVAEATGDNIFVYRQNRLITPPLSVGILEGITRDTVIDLAREAGVPVGEEVFNQYDLYNADECFLTGTAAEIVPVVKIDGRIIGEGRPGPVTRDLIARFRELTATDGVAIE